MTAIFRRAIGSRGKSAVETSWAARWARCLAATAVVASAVALTHAPAAAQPGGFSDVTGGFYKPAVDALAALGTFEGTLCGDDTFCPDEPLKRSTMAVWVVRVLDGADPSPISRSRFDDVDADSFYAPFSERTAELGVTTGCGDGSGFCPDKPVSRGQMATHISRSLALPEADPIGFWDVDEDSHIFGPVNRLVAAGLDDGCSEIRFVPFDFCPGQMVSRGELAELLSEVIDYIEAHQIIKITEDSGADDSIGLSVTHKDLWGGVRVEVGVAWNNPGQSNRGDVSHYVLQWRPSWDDFNYRRYQVVAFDKEGRYRVELPQRPPSAIYAVRVIMAYDNKDEDHLATEEVKIENQSHRMRDAIKTHIVDAYGESQPWLVDTWRHLNGPHLSLYAGPNQVTRSSVGGWEQLEQVKAAAMTFGGWVGGFEEFEDPDSGAMGGCRN